MTHPRSPRHLSAFILITLFATLPCRAGVVYEIETTDHSGSARDVQKNEVVVEGKNLKISTSAAGKPEIVWQGDGRRMIVINHKEKSYMVIDKATLEAMLSSLPQTGTPANDPATDAIQQQMQEAMKKMEDEMATMNPQQRAMVEEMLKSTMQQTAEEKMNPATEFVSTGETATLHEYPCARVDVMKGKERVRELWVTRWDRIEGGQEAWGVFQDMAGFLSEIQEMAQKAAGPMGALFSMEDASFTDFTKVDGFPVVTRDFEQGTLDSETVLKSATRRDIPPASFEPPAGYALRTMGSPQ